MADAPLNMKIKLWRLSSILAIVCALAEAFLGDGACFLWAIAAWVEWRIADYLAKQKGDRDEF